jgi:hypothetical protein
MYSKRDKQFIFILDGKAKLELDEVCVLYDPECYTLLKHGSEEICKAMQKKCFVAGLPFPIMIKSKYWKIESLNQIISCSGILKMMLDEKGRPKGDLFQNT